MVHGFSRIGSFSHVDPVSEAIDLNQENNIFEPKFSK
jgi:hypothetical protein